MSLTIGEERALQKAKRSCWKNDEVMCSSDEFKIISDLSNFKNLAAMMKAEAIMRQRKIERRRKKKRKIEFQAQDELSVCIGDSFLFSDFIWLWGKIQDKEIRVLGTNEAFPCLYFSSLHSRSSIAWFIGLLDSHINNFVHPF